LTGKLRELIAWELQENWAFPVLELIVAITIIQVLPIISFLRTIKDVSRPFWGSMVFITAISVAVVFGRSFGESVERRKLVVLLSYPVSRVRVFAAKFLANLLTTLLVFGSVLLVEGALLFMFDPGNAWLVELGLAPTVWALMFISLFLVVFFTGSLMTFLALAVKKFGLSILFFLVYVFGMEYWTGTVGNNAPQWYLSLDSGPNSIVSYLAAWYYNTLGVGHVDFGVTLGFFLTAFCYLLVGGLVFLLASLVLMWRIDLD
jgi:ABC-type transport system involved in multi-copper enzyme maturation permease subunit